MLLGREEIGEEKGENGSDSSFDDSEITYDYIDNSQNDEVQEFDDNDSPYFVKITLESKFLILLDEPSIVECHEIEGKTQTLIENEVFQQIIQREIMNMFGFKKEHAVQPIKRQNTLIKKSDNDIYIPN